MLGHAANLKDERCVDAVPFFPVDAFALPMTPVFTASKDRVWEIQNLKVRVEG